MMDLGKIQHVLMRATLGFVVASAVLVVLLLASVVTGWPVLAHSAAQDAATARIPADLQAAESITADQVAERTRGKAILRTLRVTAPKTADEAGRFRLTGTSLRGGTSKAYVRDTKMNETLTLRVGSVLGGQYEVVSIQKDVVELKRGTEHIALRK